jgi:hypothetical protein
MTDFAPSVHRHRLEAAAASAAVRDLDAVLVTPSSDYRYLLGYLAPDDFLAGRADTIFDARDAKLETAREARRVRRAEARGAAA